LILYFIELPAEFKKPLTDLTAKEEDKIILECELSKPDKPVKWLKDGKEIKPDDHVHFSIDLATHQLIIDNVMLDDKGKYSCICGDVTTEAKLIIEGNFHLLAWGLVFTSYKCLTQM
jgi:hypothetical protein